MLIQISGKVTHGQKYGRILGFPTANLDRRQYVGQKMKIKLGVWAGEVQVPSTKHQVPNKSQNLKSKIYKSAIVIGPIDKTGRPKIEAHLLGFKGDLYGKKISITLKKYLRPFRRYNHQTELIRHIKKDILKVRSLKYDR